MHPGPCGVRPKAVEKGLRDLEAFSEGKAQVEAANGMAERFSNPPALEGGEGAAQNVL